jgi:hypothetical protein
MRTAIPPWFRANVLGNATSPGVDDVLAILLALASVRFRRFMPYHAMVLTSVCFGLSQPEIDVAALTITFGEGLTRRLSRAKVTLSALTIEPSTTR